MKIKTKFLLFLILFILSIFLLIFLLFKTKFAIRKTMTVIITTDVMI